MATSNRLNDHQVKAAKAGANGLNAKGSPKPYKLSDGLGLYLFVTATGAKSWRLDYAHGDVERTMTLGQYPDVTLKRAREKRDDARRLIADNTDPMQHRKDQKRANRNTFGLIAEEWLAVKALGVKTKRLSKSYYEKTEGRVTAMLLPAFRNRKITEIQPDELFAVLMRPAQQGHVETTHKLRQLATEIWRHAINTGRAERDITAGLKGKSSPLPNRKDARDHFAAIIDPTRFGELLHAIDCYMGQPTTEFALKLLPLVFTRPGELRKAEWSEFDLDAAQWDIPKARMKMREPHLVPLSTQAVKILKQLKAHTGGSTLLFPSLATPSNPISENTLNMALRRMGFEADEMVSHGFRASARTMLDERLHYRPDWVEHQLAHTVRDANGRAYNRAKFLEERREMMQRWANYCDELKVAAKKRAEAKRGVGLAATEVQVAA